MESKVFFTDRQNNAFYEGRMKPYEQKVIKPSTHLRIGWLPWQMHRSRPGRTI